MARREHMSSGPEELEYARNWESRVRHRDGVAVTMNCGIGSKTQSSDESISSLQERIPILIANLWKQNKNVDIILLQECPGGTHWLDKTLDLLYEQSTSTWERKLEMESNTVGGKANVIIFDTSKYESDPSRNTQGASDEFNIDLKDPLAPNNKAKRHAYCRLLAKDRSNFQMDVLSFHGVENDVKNKAKRSPENKQLILRDYIETLYKKSKRNMIPILIGGDWNLEIIPDFLENPSSCGARLWKPPFVDVSCKRFQKNVIDYFIVFDYWGSHRSEKTMRLLNIVDTPVAKPHTDHKLAAQLDHDPVFVTYKTFTFDCKNHNKGNVPVFPRSLMSRYMNTETVRLQHDVNIIFPRRCMERTVLSATWGELLSQGKDEIVLRYYYYNQGEYFYGSEVSPMGEENEEKENEEVRSQQSSITYSDNVILKSELHEHVVDLLENENPERPEKSRITLTELRSLNTRNKKILRTNVFPRKLFYSKGLPTLDAEIRILHAILVNEKEMWTKEEMEAFIDSQFEMMVQNKQGKVLGKLKEFSTAQKVKFLYHVQLLLGYEIDGTTIQPRVTTLENLQDAFRVDTLRSFFSMFGVSTGQSTKEEMCRYILTLKDDVSNELRSREASESQKQFIKSLEDFLKQQLPDPDDALWQYIEDPGSQMLMPVLEHTRKSSRLENTTEDVQCTTPQQYVCDAGATMGSTTSSITTALGPSSHALTPPEAVNSPAAVDSTIQDGSQTRRNLGDLLDRAADTTGNSSEERKHIIHEDTPSSSTAATGPSSYELASATAVITPATVDSTIQSDSQTLRDNIVPNTLQEDEEIHEIIRRGLEAIHVAIRAMKHRPNAVLNRANLLQLQRQLQQEKDPRDRSLGKFLDPRIQSDGTSGEYRKFQMKHTGAYAYTTYIMDYLVVKVGYDTGSRKKKSFLARFS